MWRQTRCPIRWGRLVSVSSVGGEGIPVPGIFTFNSESFFSPRLWSFLSENSSDWRLIEPKNRLLRQPDVKPRTWRPARRGRSPRNSMSSTRPSCPKCWGRKTTSTAPTARQKVPHENAAETSGLLPEIVWEHSLTGSDLCLFARLS